MMLRGKVIVEVTLLVSNEEFSGIFDYLVLSLFPGNIQNLEKTRVIVYDSSEFSVNHYTGTVSYSVKDMPEKNRDFLAPEIIDTMRSSQNSAISMFFTNKLDRCGNLYIPMEQIKKRRYVYSQKVQYSVLLSRRYKCHYYPSAIK